MNTDRYEAYMQFRQSQEEHATKAYGRKEGMRPPIYVQDQRVVWLRSLDWERDWQYGTVTEIRDMFFARLQEWRTMATVLWDNGDETCERIDVRADIAPAETVIRR